MITNRVVHKVAEQLDLPVSEVRKILKLEFKLVLDTMMNDDKESIRLPKFGSFQFNEKRIVNQKIINKIKEIKDESKSNL